MPEGTAPKGTRLLAPEFRTWRRYSVMVADRVIRWSTVVAVAGVASVAAVVSRRRGRSTPVPTGHLTCLGNHCLPGSKVLAV
jgi:hypothetical protein